MQDAAQALLAPVLAIAERAAEQILAVYDNAVGESKADLSPITEADRRANRVIVEGLARLTPHLPVVSEESDLAPYETRRAWPRYWLVDPLDGTREFLAHNGEFTVNIALIDHGLPVLGVVQAPVRATAWAGIRGAGAWRSERGVQSTIRAASSAASPPRVLASRSHRGDSLDRYLARLGPHELIGIGSSLKICLIAEGAADIYPRLGPTYEWDTAAAHAVLDASGGTLTDLEGTPLAYNTRADLLNPHFLAYADRGRDWHAAL
jgi:3'(2'), 5'-bisphosphate nucleotidase